MLEGEIQPMYMCKPGQLYIHQLYGIAMDQDRLYTANWNRLGLLIVGIFLISLAIERAMAYIDTGELPWDMDLLDQTSEVSCDDVMMM